jgi:ABC-type glutathione transport system ATPase component
MAEKKAAIAAKKAARRANERPSGERPSGDGSDGEEEDALGGWTDQEQAALEEALRSFPQSLPKDERWEAIAQHVGRSTGECVQRIKDLKAAIQQKHDRGASGGDGSQRIRDGGEAAAPSGEGDGAGGLGAAEDEAPVDGGVTRPGRAVGKAGRGKAGEAAETKALDKRMAALELRTLRGVPVASEDLPFHQRTGAFAAKRKSMSMDIRVDDIRMCAGKQELLDRAILALNFGVKYGLVGRNGVGKTTLLRHLAEGLIQLPSFLHIVHVEQVRVRRLEESG